MEAGTVAEISTSMQKLTEELDRLPNAMDIGSPKSYPEDSDSESYSPKVWRKNPLIIRKTKKAHDRCNGYPSDGSDEELEDPKRKYKRKGTGSPRSNGRGVLPRSEMQEMFDKFEELKQKRHQLESAPEESLSKLHRDMDPRVPDPRYQGRYMDNMYQKDRTIYTAEIHERLADRREWFEQIPQSHTGASDLDNREYYMDDRYMDSSYPDNIANKRKLSAEHMPVGNLPRDQYDFRGHLPASHLGPSEHMTRMPHTAQYAQLNDNAPIHRISSFENIYNAVDLSTENPPMHRVDYEPRAKVPRHRDGQIPDINTNRPQYRDDPICGLMDLPSGASSENLPAGMEASSMRPTDKAESPYTHDPFDSVPQGTPTDERRELLLRKKEKLLGSTSSAGSVEDVVNAEETINKAVANMAHTKRKPWGAEDLLKEEQEKYKAYRQNYERRLSERSDGDEDKLPQEQEKTLDEQNENRVIPPDDYEYILRRVVHQRQDALVGENFGRKFQLIGQSPAHSTASQGTVTPQSPNSDFEGLPTQSKPQIVSDHIIPSKQEPQQAPGKDYDRVSFKAYIQGDTSWIKHRPDDERKDKDAPEEHKPDRNIPIEVKHERASSLDKGKSMSTPKLDYGSGLYITAVFQPKTDKAETTKEMKSPISDTGVAPTYSPQRDPRKVRNAWHWPVRTSALPQQTPKERPIKDSVKAKSEPWLSEYDEPYGEYPPQSWSRELPAEPPELPLAPPPTETEPTYAAVPKREDREKYGSLPDQRAITPRGVYDNYRSPPREPYTDPRQERRDPLNTFPRTSPTRTIRDRRYTPEAPYPDPRLRPRGTQYKDFDPLLRTVERSPPGRQYDSSPRHDRPDQRHPAREQPSPTRPDHRHPGREHPSPIRPDPRHPGREHPSPIRPDPRHSGREHPSPTRPDQKHPGREHPSPTRPDQKHPGREHPSPGGVPAVRPTQLNVQADPGSEWVNRSLRGHYRVPLQQDPLQQPPRPASQPTPELAGLSPRDHRPMRPLDNRAPIQDRSDVGIHSRNDRYPTHTEKSSPRVDRPPPRPTSQPPPEMPGYGDRYVDRLWQSQYEPNPPKGRVQPASSSLNRRDMPPGDFRGGSMRDPRQTDWDRPIPRTNRMDQSHPVKQRLVRTGSEPDIQAYYAQQQRNARPLHPMQPTGSLPMYRGTDPRHGGRGQDSLQMPSRQHPERRSMGPSYGRPDKNYPEPRSAGPEYGDTRPGDSYQRGRPRDRRPTYGYDKRSQSAERLPREPYRMSEEVRKMAMEHLGKPSVEHTDPIYKRTGELSQNQQQPYSKPDDQFYNRAPEQYRNPRSNPSQDAHGYYQNDPYFSRVRHMSDPNLARMEDQPNYHIPPQQQQRQPLNRGQPSRQSDKYSPAEKIINKYKDVNQSKSPPVDKQISQKEEIYAIPKKLSERSNTMPKYVSEPQLHPGHLRYPERVEHPQQRPRQDQYDRVPLERINRTETGPLPQQRPEFQQRVPLIPDKQGPQAVRDTTGVDYHDPYHQRQNIEQRQNTAPHHHSTPSLNTAEEPYYARPNRSHNYRPENRYSSPYDNRQPEANYYHPVDRQHEPKVPVSPSYKSQANITMSAQPEPHEKKVPDQFDRQLSQELPNTQTNMEQTPQSRTSGLGARGQIISQPMTQQLQPDKEPKLPSQIWKSLVEPPTQPTQTVLSALQPVQSDKPTPSQVWGNIISGSAKPGNTQGELLQEERVTVNEFQPQVLTHEIPEIMSKSPESPSKRSIVTVKVPGQSEPKNVDASYHTPSEATQEFRDQDAVTKREDIVKELKDVFENKMTTKEDPPELEHSFIKWAPPSKKSNFRMEPHPLAKITPKDHAFPVMLKGKEAGGPTLYSANDTTQLKDEVKNIKDLNSIKENLYGPDGEPTEAQIPMPSTCKSPAQTNGRPKSPWESQVEDEYISEFASYKDTLQKRRPQIHDDLTELEQIYDGLALEGDEETRQGTHSAFRPVLKDKTHRQNLQESPSMEYAKQWLISDGGNDSPKSKKDDVNLLSHSYLKSPSVASTASLQGKLPKKIGDDMAYRKHHQASNGNSDPQSQTYIGPSPGITPAVSQENLKAGSSQTQEKITPSKTSADYMEPRTTAPQRERFRNKPEKDADKYHDDMAYRHLRKDLPPVTVKLPGLAEFHQRIRSRSLERTKAEADTANQNRSSSIERDEARKKQGDPAKLPVSNGVAKMVQMFSSTAQSAPDLTDQSIFNSKKYDESGNLVTKRDTQSSTQTEDSKAVLTKPASKQTVRGVKQKSEKTKTKPKATTAGEPDEASYNETESVPSSGSDLQRSSPDGAIEIDNASPKQSLNYKASSDSGYSKSSGDSPSKTAVPVAGGTMFSLALTGKAKVPTRTEPAPNRKYTSQAMSLKPVSSSSLGGATSPFKPIEPYKMDSEFGPESIEVQHINRSPALKSPDKKPSGINSPLTKASLSLVSPVKNTTIQPKLGLLQPKTLPSITKITEITRDTKIKTSTVQQTVRTVTKQPPFPVVPERVISHKTQYSQDSQLSLGDMMERADDEVSDVESLANLVAKQGILSPYEDFDFSDYENIRSSPEASKTPTLKPLLTTKPPKSDATQAKEIIKPTPVLPASEVKMRPGRDEIRRRTVEVMLKPDSDTPSWQPSLQTTFERSDRPKSFHELVANFESQACPLFRGSQGGVWKQLRKVSSEEGLNLEK